MKNKNILQKDYTANTKFYQLKLPFDIDYIIPANDSVRLLSQFIEEMDLTDLYSTYSRVRENQVSPMKMLKIMIYGYMNGLYSSRDIENACRRDINFMYLRIFHHLLLLKLGFGKLFHFATHFNSLSC